MFDVQKFMEFIGNAENVNTYLHTTNKDAADAIIRHGFQFAESLRYTTDMVNADDPVGITYWINERKSYGDHRPARYEHL